MAHTILIVDDSPTAGPELRALLEHEGYQVLTALRAEEALDTLRTSKVDLVITEALLPTMDGFELVRQIRNLSSGSGVPVVMLTVRSAPEDYAMSFEAGVNEYFLKPVDPPKIIAAARGLIARYELGKLDRPGGRPTGPGGLPSRAERGKIIAVFSLKGGVGTTSIAVNLAVAIKQATPSSRVGLIDLSLEEGHDALLLDVVPSSTIVEWAREDTANATPHLLNQYFVQHRTGISLLAAPSSPEQAEIVRPNIVRTTLELAPLAFDYTVIDTASNFGENSLIALELAHTILLPVTPDMASMKSAVNTLRILGAVNIRQDKVQILANEIIPRAGLTRDQLETGLGRKTTSLPHAGPALMEATNQGTPLVTLDPPPATARAIIDLARTLCTPEVEDGSTQKAAAGSLFKGQLGDRFKVLRRA